MESKFYFDIRVNDETGIWQAIWNNLKDHLNLHFIPLSYKENNNTKSLANLNLRLLPNAENASLTIYVFKLNSFAELKPNVKENILKNIQNEKEILPVMLMEIDNNESALKSGLKVFEKIKSELKLNYLRLLPLNTNHNKLGDLINDFFRELKNRISFDISKMFFTFSSNIDNLKLIKLDNKENTYCYIANKDNLIQLLQVAEFYAEIIKLCESDVNVEFKQLDSYPQKVENKISNSSFNESFSIIDFNEDLIKNKIEKRLLTNIDYQIYLFHLIINNYKQMREFKKLYSFVLKFINNLNNLKSFFVNIYYYNFWCIEFIGKVIPFYKTLRSSYLTACEEELNLKARNQVFYILKKNYKSFSKLLAFEIPNTKIYKILATSNQNDSINKNNDSDEKEINHIELSFENQLERRVKNLIFSRSSAFDLKNSDENYNNFINDINKNLDEKSKSLVLSKEKFLEEYLNVINNLEKSHLELNEKRLIFKLHLEKLPILFALGKFTEMKNLLLDNLKKIKKIRDNKNKSESLDNWDKSKYMTIDRPGKSIQNTRDDSNSKAVLDVRDLGKNEDLNKWPLLKEYVCSLLILLLNSLDKSTENIRIIIDILNVYQSNDTISSYFDLKDKNVIKSILTKYLDDNINLNYKHSNSNNSYSAISNGERETANNLFKINLNEIIDFNYSLIDPEDNKPDDSKISNLIKSIHKYKKIFFYNKEKEKNLNLNFEIKNRTDLEMKITSITIEFFDEVNDQKIKYDYVPIINNENSENKESENAESSSVFIIKGSDNTNFKFELDVDNLDKIKNSKISSLVINKIYLYLTWGVLGIYKFKNHDSLIYLKNNDFEIYSTLNNFHSKNNQLIDKLVAFNKHPIQEARKDKDHLDSILLNVDNPLFINFAYMNDFDFSKYYIDINLKLSSLDLLEKDELNDLTKSKSEISNKDNIKKNYNEDEVNLKLEVLNDLEIVYFDENFVNEDVAYLVSLPKDHEIINEKLIEQSNYDIENIKSELNSSSKEKNIKIFNKEITQEIVKNSNLVNEDDLFFKYILKNQRKIDSNKIYSFKINKRKIENSDIDNNQEFIIVLHLLFSNSDFNSYFKQKLSVLINIRKNTDHSIVFETREDYCFKLKHIFKFISRSTLKNSKTKNIPNNADLRYSIDNDHDVEDKSKSEASNDDSPSFRSKINEKTAEKTKENIFILLQNSISLNMDLTNILLKSNRAFNKINCKQIYEIINKIPFNYKESSNSDNYDSSGVFSFKDIFFYFMINTVGSRLSERKFKNESIDNFISGDNVSNHSSEEIVLKKPNIKIGENLEFDEDQCCFAINKYKFFYPVNLLIDKLQEISYIEYLINLSFYEKIDTKNDNKARSILHTSSQPRSSIALTFLNSQENFLALGSSLAYLNSQINHRNSVNRESSKRLSLRTNNNPINCNLPKKFEKHYFEIYKEVSISLTIKHLSKRKTYFMIKVKEDDNWTTVGKSRIIEKFDKEETEKIIIIKLIPLQDGYIKLPELLFSDFQVGSLDESERDRNDSVNHVEFFELNKNSVWIEGNEKILKINPVNQTSIKVNVI